jgi:hypothetical protein
MLDLQSVKQNVQILQIYLCTYALYSEYFHQYWHTKRQTAPDAGAVSGAF